MVEERMRLKEMVNIKALFASLIIHTFQFIFFSRNSVFLSQQISRNSVSAYFFSETNGAMGARNAQCEDSLEQLFVFGLLHSSNKQLFRTWIVKKLDCAKLSSNID